MQQRDRAQRLREFFDHVVRLKHLPRRGWVDRGVPPDDTESVAEHSFQTTIVAWFAAAADPTLNRERVLKLALVHDLPEALIGDMTPYDQRDVPDPSTDLAGWRAFLDARQHRHPDRTAHKRAAEGTAIAVLLALLDEEVKLELAALFQELAEGQTPESRFVKQADKLETWLQSRWYAGEYPDLPMASFQREIDELPLHPALAKIRDTERLA